MRKYQFTHSCLPSYVSNLTDFEKNIICISLSKLVNNRHYSICDLDKLMKLLGVTKASKDYELFSLMHCVDYYDMGEQTADELIDKTLKFLGIDTSVVDVPVTIVKGKPVPENKDEFYNEYISTGKPQDVPKVTFLSRILRLGTS